MSEVGRRDPESLLSLSQSSQHRGRQYIDEKRVV